MQVMLDIDISGPPAKGS